MASGRPQFWPSLRNDFFDKAVPKLGRFRDFLLSALKHFVANARQAALAKKRHPSKGFAFMDESVFAEEHPGALKTRRRRMKSFTAPGSENSSWRPQPVGERRL